MGVKIINEIKEEEVKVVNVVDVVKEEVKVVKEKDIKG